MERTTQYFSFKKNRRSIRLLIAEISLIKGPSQRFFRIFILQFGPFPLCILKGERLKLQYKSRLRAQYGCLIDDISMMRSRIDLRFFLNQRSSLVLSIFERISFIASLAARKTCGVVKPPPSGTFINIYLHIIIYS